MNTYCARPNPYAAVLLEPATAIVTPYSVLVKFIHVIKKIITRLLCNFNGLDAFFLHLLKYLNEMLTGRFQLEHQLGWVVQEGGNSVLLREV